MMRGQRVAQVIAGGIAVFPDLGLGGLHRGDGLRRGAEDVFIGADAGAERRAALALLRFGPDKGHGCGQAGDKGGIAGSGHGGVMARGRQPRKWGLCPLCGFAAVTPGV